jgi:AhpD family alkylhydroperoxidase
LIRRFDKLGVPSTEQSRRAYREMLFTTSGAAEFISGAILYDETIRQKSSGGTPLAQVLSSQELAPETEAAFRQFSQAVFRDGALPGKTKQLIAVAIAHVTQCPYCIKGHTKAALRHGATPEELMEAIWVAAEMRAGGAYAHSALALETVAEASGR